MNTIIEGFSAKEAIFDLEFENAQKSFARTNNIFIDLSEHPLQQEIDNQ